MREGWEGEVSENEYKATETRRVGQRIIIEGGIISVPKLSRREVTTRRNGVCANQADRHTETD